MRNATFAFVALLAATPAVAQWTVSTYAGGATGLTAPTSAGAGDVGLALDPTSSAVVATGHVIWRIRAGGLAERIAGTGTPGFSGDGGPATQAQLNQPQGAQSDAAGNVYFYDSLNSRIRRVDLDGIITTVAGTGLLWGPGLDREGPATSRNLPNELRNFTVRSTGDFYFTDGFSDGIETLDQIRRVNTSGVLEVIAGDLTCGTCIDGDHIPAAQAHLGPITNLVFDAAGNLYVTDGTIRRVSPDRIVTRVFGSPGGPKFPPALVEGQAALSAYFGAITSLVVDGAGTFYFLHRSAVEGDSKLLRIGTDGLIHVLKDSKWTVYSDATGRLIYVFSGSNGTTLFDFITGSSLAFIPRSTTQEIEIPDGTPAANVEIPSLTSLALSRSGELYYADGCRIRKIGTDGTVRTVKESDCAAFHLPYVSIAFDSQDRVWARTSRGFATIVAPDGTVSGGISPPYAGLGPESIALDTKDRLYVSSVLGVVRVETDGTFRKIFGSPFSPSGQWLGSDLNGNVYISSGGIYYRVLDDGTLTSVFSGSAPLCGSGRLTVDARGRVWWGLGYTDPDGSFCLGLRGGYGGDGGPVQSARFQTSGESVMAPDGTIYVKDGPRIRKLTPNGQTPTPIISTGGIVNSASYTGGGIAPGELISIFGFNFGAPEGSIQVGQAVNNVVPSALGRTKVLFGTVEGNITAVTPTQINAFVPYRVTPGTLVDVRVLVDDVHSLPMRVPVVEQAFDLFTLDMRGSGQGAIFNQDTSLNGPGNPALRGTIISIWGTGAGRLFPQLPDGALMISTPYSKPNVPVTVRIGGAVAEVLYAGAAPMLPNGAFQINVRIPEFTSSGNASISVSVGSSTTTRNVTVAVQ